MENKPAPTTKQSQKELSTKTISIILVVLLVVIGLIVEKDKILNLSNKKEFIDPNWAATTTPVAYEQIDKTKLPPGFPKDLPMEKNATTTQNNTVSLGSGKSQSIREFESKVGVDQNVHIYYDYFKKNGWTFKDSDINPLGTNYFFAIKSGQELNMTVRKVGETSSIVNLTIVNYDSKSI